MHDSSYACMSDFVGRYIAPVRPVRVLDACHEIIAACGDGIGWVAVS